MKTLRFFLVGLMLICLSQNSFSAISYSVPGRQTDTKPTAITLQQRIAMEKFIKLTPKEYGVIRGKKLSFFERIAFRAEQRKMQRKLSGDSEGFNAGGFFLGFFLGLIGVLGAYIFSKDRNFRKWTWYGWLGWLVVFLIFFIANYDKQ